MSRSYEFGAAVKPEDTLLPSGRSAYVAMRNILEPFFAKVEWDEDITDDGGAMLELENEHLGREVLFVVPDDGSDTYFYVRDDAGYRIAGIVKNQVGIRHLAQWAVGETDSINTLGLALGR